MNLSSKYHTEKDISGTAKYSQAWRQGKCFVTIFIHALVDKYQKIQSFAALIRSGRSLVRFFIFLNPSREIVYAHFLYFCVAEPDSASYRGPYWLLTTR